MGFAPFSQPEAGLGFGGNVRKTPPIPRDAQSAARTSRGGQRDLSSCCWVYSQREVTKGAPSSPDQGLEQPGVVGDVPGWDWIGFKVSSSPIHSMIPSVSVPGSSSEFPRNKSQDLHSTLGFTGSGSVPAWIRPPPVPGMQIQVNQRFLGFFPALGAPLACAVLG